MRLEQHKGEYMMTENTFLGGYLFMVNVEWPSIQDIFLPTVQDFSTGSSIPANLNETSSLEHGWMDEMAFSTHFTFAM